MIFVLQINRIDHLPLRIPLNPQLHRLRKRLRKVCVKDFLVISVPHHPLLEARVRQERHICRQHHQLLAQVLVYVHKLEHAVV